MKKTFMIIILLLWGNVYAQPTTFTDEDFDLIDLGDDTLVFRLTSYSWDTISWEHNGEVYEILISEDCTEREKLDIQIPFWFHLWYEDECLKDSLIVGYRYIITEDSWGGMSQDIYILTSHPKYNCQDGWYKPLNYIREVEIKEPFSRPTYPGFLLWVKQKLNIDQ